MIDVISSIISVLIVMVMFKAVWTSTLILDERKKRYKAGTHDYYGNKIDE